MILIKSFAQLSLPSLVSEQHEQDCTGYNLEQVLKYSPEKEHSEKKNRNFFKKGIRLKGKKKIYETMRWGVGVQTWEHKSIKFLYVRRSRHLEGFH